ncbi:uncharacterized protein VP01_4578g3, partial [Puccinia sorghi]
VKMNLDFGNSEEVYNLTYAYKEVLTAKITFSTACSLHAACFSQASIQTLHSAQLLCKAWLNHFWRMFGVRTEASWDFLHFNCRKLSQFVLQCLKWVQNYYYDGFTSWSWFYSPMISGSTSSSNLINFLKLNFSFNLSNPFKPFEKLRVFFQN